MYEICNFFPKSCNNKSQETFKFACFIAGQFKLTNFMQSNKIQLFI